ncbi:MAG: hypothetical protein DME01_26140 [Candidatus Rokuibacteriota bacterium]|nr:MAG: hypothetical protein DME01_26140 [Candidatus Rokubacteria bacterium]
MKTSAERILTSHVGSIPRPESIRALLRARLGGQAIDEAELAVRAAEAVTEVLRHLQGPITYKGQALLEKDLATLKAALGGVAVAEAFVPAIRTPPWCRARRRSALQASTAASP